MDYKFRCETQKIDTKLWMSKIESARRATWAGTWFEKHISDSDAGCDLWRRWKFSSIDCASSDQDDYYYALENSFNYKIINFHARQYAAAAAAVANDATTVDLYGDGWRRQCSVGKTSRN